MPQYFNTYILESLLTLPARVASELIKAPF